MNKRTLAPLPVVLVMALGGCADPISSPEPGPGDIPGPVGDTPDPSTITVSISTTGPAPAGGYTVTVDDITYAIAPNDSITVHVFRRPLTTM